MRHITLRLTLVMTVAAMLAGCAKQSSDMSASVSRDSLIASDPVELPNGNLTPQETYEAAPEAPPPARRQPAPRRPAATSQTARSETPRSEPTPEQSPPRPRQAPGVVVQWGSTLHVVVADAITSETAHAGDAWTGTLTDPVFVRDRVALPAGSVVHGTVKDAKPANAGDRAMLTLEVTSVLVDASSYPVSATAEPIVAGSPRARNLGAIVGSAAAGALIGSAVGGGKGAAIGGALGGAAAGGAVARSKGFEVVIKPGTPVIFTLAKDVVVRPL